MSTVYILSDSRGDFLQQYLTPTNNYRLKVIPQKGATLGELRDMAHQYVTDEDCGAILIMGGICSITRKEINGYIHLPQETVAEVYDTVTAQIKTMLNGLDLRDSNKPVVISSIVGADLNAANHVSEHVPVHPKQEMMNQAIMKINRYIRELNTERGFETPCIANAVHRCHGHGKYKHGYSRLLDGVHPSKAVLQFWAKRLAENVQNLIDNQLI